MTIRSWVLGTWCLVVYTASAAAQQRTLPDRISGPTRAALEKLSDSAATPVGIPRAVLYDKASEGVLKGATDERILRAVQVLIGQITEARAALGASADYSVIGAGVSALVAGVSPAELKRLAHPPGPPPDPATLATALVTLVDLVANRVPVSVATSSIQNLIERRASEREFSKLRAQIGPQ